MQYGNYHFGHNENRKRKAAFSRISMCSMGIIILDNLLSWDWRMLCLLLVGVEISGLTSVLFPESPDLSLLIQNKGKGPLNVTISAPDFVHLEKTKIQLQEKDNKKVFMTDTKSLLKRLRRSINFCPTFEAELILRIIFPFRIMIFCCLLVHFLQNCRRLRLSCFSRYQSWRDWSLL